MAHPGARLAFVVLALMLMPFTGPARAVAAEPEPWGDDGGDAPGATPSVSDARFARPDISPEFEPFGLHAVTVREGPLPARWREVEDRLREENDVLERCGEDIAACPWTARRFLMLVSAAGASRGRRRIGIINRAINLAIRPASDWSQWSVPDRWSTPLETLSRGRGDCEDYAIAKYQALLRAGLRPQDVRLVIVHLNPVDEDHAMVAVRLDGDWVMLDNRRFALIRDISLRGIRPMFVLDHDGVRRFVEEEWSS